MILIEGNFIIFIDGKTFFLRQNGAGTFPWMAKSTPCRLAKYHHGEKWLINQMTMKVYFMTGQYELCCEKPI